MTKCRIAGCENEEGELMSVCEVHKQRHDFGEFPTPPIEALDIDVAVDETRKGWEGETGGVKFDQGKPRMDLLDAEAIEELSKVLTFGAVKYGAHNWRKGIVLSRLMAAASRHLFAIMRGEDKDEETGLPHAAHLMCCAMFLIWTMKHRVDMDDRWQQPNRTTNWVQGIKQYLEGEKST